MMLSRNHLIARGSSLRNRRQEILDRLMEARIGGERRMLAAFEQHHARVAEPSCQRSRVARDDVLVAGRDQHRRAVCAASLG